MTSWVDDKVDARWAAFPSDASPRPIVLLDERVRVEGGFADVDSKIAWMDGAIDSVSPLPAGLSALLPSALGTGGKLVLRITGVLAATEVFRCDRGPRELPAYQLQLTGLNGRCVVLSPEVECWWPRGQAEKGLQTGGRAKIDHDDVTIHFPAFGGVLTEFHRADFQEHATYVVGRAITSKRSVPAGTWVHAIGISRRVTGRLASPLGGRALLDTDGQPLSVTTYGESGISSHRRR